MINNYSDAIDIEQFDPLQEKRLRRRKRMPSERQQDDPPTSKFNSLSVFKIDTYFFAIDRAHMALNEKFQEESIGLMKDICLLSKRRLNEVRISKKLPDNAFLSFVKLYGKFINIERLLWEYLQFAEIYPLLEKNMQLPINNYNDIIEVDSEDDGESENESITCISDNQNQNLGSIKTIFELFSLNNLKTEFPNLHAVLKISITLPVSSASCERSFSKLKLIKTRLRSTMGQESLEELMIISSEIDIPINYDEIIKKFASNSDLLMKDLVLYE